MTPLRIMVVEDSQTQIERLTHILSQEGYKVISAQNGQDALDKIADAKPDLLISDVIMPEMNGYDLCALLRKKPLYEKLIIILLTTLSNTEDIVKGLECGANYYITKPYEDAFLLLRVKNALKLQKIRDIDIKNDTATIILNDQQYTIAADKARILDLLVSIYDAAIQKNQQLHAARLELQEFNESLEKTVEERTASLRDEMERRKQYELQLIQAQKMESIGQLTGGISHDFNNILTIISGNLDFLNTNLTNDKTNQPFLQAARDAAERGSDLIKRLLAFSRRQKLQPTIVNIADVLTNTTSLLKPILGSAIQFHHEVQKELWPVLIDRGQFENALINLSVNARDAMNGKGKLTFTAVNILSSKSPENHVVKEGKYVKVSVVDNGCGIPPHLLTRVLEPFFTTKEEGKGSGLGLSMVYGFMNQSNGYVFIDSEEKVGTTVSLYLPVAAQYS